jgi:hypothetical protein
VKPPLWKRNRVLRFGFYGVLAVPLLWFHLYEALILLVLVGFVVEFACFPGKRMR